jgi:hypothetical protein
MVENLEEDVEVAGWIKRENTVADVSESRGMGFVPEDGLAIKVQVVVGGFEFVVIFDSFEGVDGFGEVAENGKGGTC